MKASAFPLPHNQPASPGRHDAAPRHAPVATATLAPLFRPFRYCTFPSIIIVM